MDDLKAFVAGPSSKRSASKKNPSKVLVTPVKAKKNSMRLNVYLEHSRHSQQESEEMAIRCFKKFNKREPNEAEIANIRAFIQTDTELKEQTFLVSKADVA